MFIFPFFMMNSHTQKEEDTFHNLCGFHVAQYQFFCCSRMVYVLSLLCRKMLEVGAFLVQHRSPTQVLCPEHTQQGVSWPLSGVLCGRLSREEVGSSGADAH